MQTEPLSYSVIVKNTTQQPIRRGGQVFLPREERRMTCNKYQFAEVKACTYLHVRVLQSPAVDIPMGEARVAQIIKKSTEKPKATNASPEPAEDASDGSQEVLAALPQETVPENPPEETFQVIDGVEHGTLGKFDCPYCDRPGTSRVGLFSHVRGAHKDKYEEFKAGRSDK